MKYKLTESALKGMANLEIEVEDEAEINKGFHKVFSLHDFEPVEEPMKKGDKVRMRYLNSKHWMYGFYDYANDHGTQFLVSNLCKVTNDWWDICEPYEWTMEDLKGLIK